jgi:hypothetical protein
VHVGFSKVFRLWYLEQKLFSVRSSPDGVSHMIIFGPGENNKLAVRAFRDIFERSVIFLTSRVNISCGVILILGRILD